MTLGVEGAAAGYDDPWGANVTYSWSQSAGTAVTYDTGKGAATVRPSFTAPAEDETLTFTLTVTGRGAASSGSVNRHRGASTVSVRVGAAGVRPMPVGAAVNGATLTLTYGEDLQAIDPAAVPVSSRGPAYLPVVSEPGVRRNIETVGVSTARASGRTVIITLARTVVPNQVVTLSYFPDNATAASRVRDRVGNLAGAFAGLRVRNETSQPPVVGDIAFAGAAKTYRIGETVGIDVTFSEPVTVTGRPTLALEIGSAGRKARWKAGQAAGAVQRFEYTVAEGEEDKDGIAVKADGLAVPSGSAIVTTAEREAVILGHGRVHDPAHKVDGVRPTVPQIGISPSHCNVSDANELWCATLTVERYEAGGSVFYGYLRSGGYGSVAPDTFTYRGVDVAVSALHKSIRSGTPLRFEVGPASGAAPAGGLLGAVSFSLEIGTGAGRKTLAIETPGTRTGFEFSGHNFEWNNGDRVPVKLVRRGAQATAASISSSPSRGSTYRAGETVTVRLAMSEAVLVTGRPYVVLDVGGVRRRAVYAGPIGSATDVLDFDYTVQAGDFDTDGVALCGRGAGCGRIALDGGSIRASYDGSVASLGHPALGAQSGHKADAAAALTLMPPTACANEIRVPDDWPLTPSGVSAGGKFRLLFVTSTARDATSSNIADYNRFVQNRAAAGHSSIRPYKDGFRAVGSTDAADARDNTCTTGTGVEIHWLNGNKVADDYADFYDDSWDDANLKNEGGNGITGSNIQVFTGSGADGTAAADHYLGVASPNTAVIAIMPTPVRPLAANLGDVRGTRRFYGLSQVFKVPAASDRAHTTDIAIISSPAIGDAYRLGETVEVEVTYSEAVSVRGTPAVGLSVKHAIENYDIEYNAAYVRGSGTTKLVFAFTVPGGLKDDNGILLYSNPLRLNGARIATVSDGSSAAWTLAAWRNIGGKVDTSLPLSGGVCDRTPAVRYAIVAAVTAASDCSQVTEAHLAGMTGTLEFSGLTSIAAGDLAGLSSLTRLNLYGSGIETLPVGLFDGLGSLTRLDVRAGLTHLPKDIFRGLGKVTFLSLDGLEYPESPGNRLREGGLPDGIFEPLSREVKEFWIFGSPGSESFRPRAADAGPGGMLSAGQKVTLGGPGNDGGPWGSNVFYRWRQKDGSGNAVSTVALPVTDEVNVVANPSFTVPTLAEATEVRFQLQLDGAGKKLDGGAHGDASLRLGLYSPVSEARFTILALAPTAVAVVSKPVDGDTYRQGEKIEVAVTFGDRVLVDTSLGTPALGLAVGTETRQATYVRGTGSNRLVFEYTVQSGDTGSDGIAIAANGLAPGGGAIASVYGVRAILDHAALAAQTGHKVDGSLTHGFDLTGGVCGRTPQVRDKLLELVKANDSNVTDCSKVTAAHLAALTEQLYLDHAGIATLKRGDFAGLGGIEILTLNANDLTALTAGVFEGLDDTLTLLWLGENDLQTIAPGVFDGLKGLTLLQLTDNDLSLLPPRIFEKLTGLDDLFLGDNPGSARFAPIAKAGPAGGIEVVSGGNVTLGVEGAENGFDDPWGTNVTWAWSRTEGAGGMLADDTAARAAFTAPVTGEDKTYTFRLAVTGSDLYTTTADIAVRVAAGPKTVEAAFASEPAGGSAYAGGETIEVALHFDRAVTVDIAGGTPSVTLTVGAAPRTAGYLRGSDTRVLTFGYTVQAADMDADGVDLVANSLALNGGKIAAVSDGGLAALGHTALSGGSGRTVNVAGTPAARGICDRTAAVQTAILARVRADENDASLQCGDIGPVRLVAIGGRLDLSAQARNGRMTALRAGDFAWLANVTVLDLDNHALRSFPAGIFDPLTALSELSIAYNQTQAADRLTSLPAGLFDRLTKLTTLRLEHNDLETLPDGIFEKLTRLTTLTLHGNPGSAAFLPVAAAGPAGGLEAETGERVTLGGDAGGPWGGNVVHAWRQVSGTAVALSATDAAKPAFAAPALAGPEDLAFELTVTGRGTSLTATDRVSVRIAAAAAVSSVVPASTPIDGDTYRRGETIGIAVGFAKPVTVTGTPQLALSVGTNTRQAAYVRGSGTGQLVFEYTVVQADADSDGIAIAADSLAPGTGAIADATGMAALLGHPALAAQAAHRVDGSLTHAFNPMAGICGRTAPVRDALLLAVRARTGDTALGCAQVTTTHLGALSGTLILAHKGIGTLKPGDFANLGGIAALQLDNNDLQTIPAGVFDRLTGLTTLSLHDNRLPSLPDRIFEGLMKLTQLSLNGNPGTADFKPTAMAGPEGGIDVPQGATTGITLGVEVPENGYDDPWGTNVTYAWSRTEGTGGTLTDATAAQAVFTPPATDGTHAFRLTVTGGGGVAATSTVNVRVGATAMGPMPVSAVVDGETLTLTYDRDLQEINPASVPVLSKGPVYLAVLSAPGARRNIETAAPSAVEVTGRQVVLTLDPPADFGDTVRLSYYPDNAVAASRVRGLGGTLADAFTGLRVDNDTPEGNTVQSFAVTGPAKTYRIGDTIGIELTFAEAVTVDVTGGAPTLALEIGAVRRKAAYVRGSGSAVLTFEYTPVALGEEDTDGIAVAANGLEVPAGSSILNTADREAAILRHGRYHDPAHKVDGVRPTASSARSEGPGVSVIWSEPLDTGAAPAGAGGFTVNVPGAANPVVTAVTISGSVVNLALNAPIALAATGVTVNYTPAATPIRDAAGNAAERFESPLAVTVAVDETPPALTAAAVNGDTLTLTYSEPLKATSPAAAAYSVGVSGGGTFTLSNIRAGVGPGNTQVVMTLDPPAQAGQTIRVAYMPNNATTATKVQDLAGNAAAGFASLSELNPPVTLVNMTGAPTLTLSKPQVTEGDDAQVTLTLSTGNTTYGSARTFTISAGADSTALQGQDWTLSSASVVLPAGKNSVTATLAIVDDARLEPAETASFKASLDGGAETAAAVLAIADDDKAVLAVRGPAQVTEGQPIELTLRLEPHPENVANLSAVPDDACILDFPVTATLTRAGDTAAALPSDPTLATDHSFAATSFDDCTREVTVSVPTKAPDAVWMADRALTFALAPKNSDARVEAGEALSAAVRDDTPEGNTVQSFAVTGPAKTYRIGDTIGIDVTFAEAVTVDVTGGAPTLALEIGAVRRKAAYVGGSGSAVLTFEYTVVKGEEDTDGIAVEANGLEVPAGSSILNTEDREAAILRHGRYHDPAYKVDGVLPTATAASAAGPTVTVTWSEALDPASLPTGAGGFRVRIGNANGPAVSAVAVSGATTTLSLASAIADGTANVTLEYSPLSGAKIRDAAGNDAAAIPRDDALAVTVPPDQRAPEVSGTPMVDGTTLTLTFDEALDTASVPPAPGGFTVTVTRGGSAEPGYTVSGLSLSPNGTVVTLTLAQAVRGGDVVTLAYATPSTPLQDRAATPNEVADFTGADAKAVDNRTPSVKGAPIFAGAAEAYAIGERIAVEVEFTQAVSVTTTSSARPEVAVEVGANTRKARYASGSGSARLRFEYAVVAGEVDSDGIAIPANALAAPAGSAIRTAAGSRAVQLGHDAVGADAARTVDGLRPTATAAAAEGLTIVVTWSEALDPASAGNGAGGFRVRIGTGNGPAVTAVAVDGTDATKLRLTLDDRIADGTQNATLEYRPPSSGAKVRDAAGNDAEDFTGSDAVAVSVTPDTTAPMVTAAAVNGARLRLTFDEALDTASVPPAPGGFTVTVTRVDDAVPGHTVTGIAVSGATVTLTLAKGVLPGDTVTLDYVPTSTRLQDRAVTPNPVAGFSGLDMMKTVDNASDALEVSLSTTGAVEGDDGTVTLTVKVTGGGTSGVARAIAIAPVASPTAAETEDWTLPAGQRSLTLGAGQRSVSAAISVVDDARLEAAETVSFAVTADGAAIGQVTLTIADDDKAVLAVRGPAQVTEGQPIELTLRLEPHPENVANLSAVPDDACILDFPVTATLTRAGDTAAALPSNTVLETEHSFATAAFDDCTREVTVSVPTKAPDAVWMADRALTFALAPKNSDPRVEAGEALSAAVRDDTPGGNTVQSFAVTGPAKTYRIGDTIGIDVTFAEAVTVDVTGGAPTLALEIGAARRKAAYVGGSGSAVLTFEATEVALGEEDTDGIAVATNGLEVPAGSSILNTADREAAILRHGRYHDPAYKVDGVLPAATAASAAGPTVMVTWSEALDEASVPAGAGGFRVRIGNANGPAVSAVAVSGPTTTLSLASAIADGTPNVTLEYTPPLSGAKIRDAAGNDAAAIPSADALAVTVTPDTRAPEVSGRPTVDGTTLTVTFDEALDTASVPPAPGGFTVAVTRAGSAEPGYTVSGLSLSSNGTVVTLTLAQAVRGGDTVTLAYATPSTPLQDRAATPNEVADFTGADAKAVDNRTPSVKGAPIFAGAAEAYAIGERIAVEVEFTQAVSVTTTSSARPEVAVEVGANTRKARYASGSGSARLRFEYAVVAGEVDSDGIAIPANALAAPAGSAIRTAAGSRAVQLGHDAVAADAARTVDGLRPTATAAAAEGLTIVVTWSEALDPASAGNGAGGFRVRIGSGNGPAVSAVAVDGTDATKLRLTLASAIADGTQNATLEYRPPSSGAKIRDAAGNDAEDFTGSDAVAVSVTPDTTAPMLAAAAVDGARLTLTFDQALDTASIPAAPGGFTVTVTRVDDAVPGHTVTGIAVSGATVTLTLAKGVLPGDTVTLDYVPTSTRLQDRAVTPNPVAGFSGLDMMKTVDNASDALEVSLSTTEAVEGDDGTVTLTVAVTGGGTSGVARAIAIAPVASPTAAETEDWTLPAGQRSLTLGAGQRSVSAAIAVVDDARLEDAETVSFAVTADGAAIGQVTLTIADDDKAVLAVRGPAQVTEGQPIELTLRLEPHPENVANLSAVPDDACILDFPVTATLTRAGDTAAALPSNTVLETEHSFATAAFDDCTREVTVSVPTKAPDAVWMADRALTFALAPKNSDPRVEAGEALSAAVRDDTPPPGPMVTGISISPGARTCDRPDPVNPSGYTKEEFLALPGCAVHGRGTTLTFTLTFDSAVTVTLDADTRALPELVLDVFGRERRAQLSGNRTDTGTLTFTWTVAKGDNDPDGIGIARIDLKGASIRFAAGCMPGLPCDIDVPTFKSDHAQTYPKHRVRGGLHAMRLSVSGSAREGEPFTVTVRRDGGYKETAHAIVRMTDSAVESPAPGEASAVNHGVRLMSFPFDADPEQGEDSRVSVQTVTPPGDGVADARTLTFKMFATDVGDSGVSYWYVTRDPVEATVTVTDTGLAGGTPDGPSLGVWDDWTREPTQEQWDRGRGFPLRFDVTVPWPNVLRPRGEAKVTVDYETRDGTATVADRDYDATRGTLTFEAGETRKTVVVEVRPDREDEGEETMTLVLSSATGAAIARAEAVGTIRNNGPIPKAWIARFGRTVAEQVLEAIEGRMRAAPVPGAEVALAGERIGAQSPDRGPDRAEPGSDAEREARQEEEARRDTQRLAGWLKGETDPEEAQRLTSRAVTPRDLLTGSSFALTAETDGKDLVSLWGRAAVTRFDGREGDLMLDGEVVTGMLGADWTRGRWTAGLIVSHSTAEGGYSGAPDAGDVGSGGKVEATLTGLFPWARHALSERLEAWGAAGYGAGELTVTPKAPGTGGDGPAIHADLDLRMAAVGLRGTILDGGADGLTLIGKTDAMAVQTASGRGRGTDGGNLEPARTTVTRLRLGVEASRPVGLGGGFTLTPSLEIGVRHDGGDAETGFGLDLGGGLALSDPKRGLQAELRGRGLLTHESKGFRDLGFSGSLAWEGNPGSDRGAKLRLTQTVGGSSSGGADALLSRTTLEGLAANDDGEGGDDELKSRRLELKFGYGLSAFGDRFTWTPEVGVDLSDTGRDYSLGWRLVLGGSGSDGGALELSFEATRRESANDDTPPVHEVGLRLTARF